MKTALVTGASSGFGLLTSLELARKGWRVVATMRDLSRREELESKARESALHDHIHVHALDVTNQSQIDSLVARLAIEHPRIDALINNAGFALVGFAEDVSDAELRRQFDTNFFGAVAVTRAFLGNFRDQGHGHVVMISSISGLCAFPGTSSYAASKFALEGWSEALRSELLPTGITVSLVEPGSFKTEIWSRNAHFSEATKNPQGPRSESIRQWRERMSEPRQLPDPQIVAEAIVKILENPSSSFRHVVGKDATKAFWLRRFLPWSLYERVLFKKRKPS